MQNKKLKVCSIAFLALTLFFSSCQKQELLKANNSDLQNSSIVGRTGDNISFREGTNTLLGDSKQNPYTVENMTAAWQDLLNRGITTNAETYVHTSHYYVKFKPKDEDDYERLIADSTITFSDIPLESNVIQNGDYYHDRSLPDSVPTFQYAAVITDYLFPKGIEYEIIDNLYIPETDDAFRYENGGTEDCFVDKLLNQAYLQTRNDEDIIDLSDCDGTIAARRYTPGGRIRVFDTRLQQWIGMEGVRVQARRWFIWYNARPDYNGNYRMSHSFKRPCNYSIWFATGTFGVRHNLVNTTFWVNGPKITGDWNYDLNNSYQRFAGHVFRGAYRYHAKNIGGLQRPWLPSKRQVYVAKDGYKDWSGVNWIILPVIRIARYETEKLGEYDSDEIFSTTSHETAHTSHVLRMNAGVIQYWQVTGQLQESWPVAIEWFLSHIEYSERGINNYGEWNYHPGNAPQYPNDQAYQYWTLSVHKEYTSLYINIVDDINDSAIFFGTPDDQVAGYSLPNIEQRMLKHCYGLSSLAKQLKNNKPAGVTDNQIDLLLSSY